MAYNYSKGTQVVGDIVGADDSNRDTKIDFADNQINLQTAGSTVLAVKSSTVEITGSLAITEASTTRNNLGLGDIATQNSSSVTIAGGTINNTTIGATSQNSGKFTTLSASSNLNVAGNTVLDGALFFYGNGIFGDDSSDNITINAKITGSLFAINGGAINNTTIGGTTPSTANFTQLTGSNVLIGTTSTNNITLGGILYSNKTGSIAAQATNPVGLYFKTDGSVAYIADITTNKVFQYTLSTPWDISTISYANKTASIATEESALQDIFIDPNGTYLYAIGTTGDDVNQYTLSTPWDISTATFFGSSSANGSEATPTGLFFKPDGTSVFIVGTTTDTVRQHVLGTAWDVRTMSVSALNSYSVSAQEGSPSGIAFSSDGKKMFLVGTTTGARTVYEYLLPTAWNLSSISKVVPHDLSSTALLSNSVITSLFLKEDGTNFYVINNIGDIVIQYQTITSSVQVYDAPIQLVEGMTAFGAVAAPSLSTTTLKANAATFNTLSTTSTITSVGTISGSSTLLVGGAITGSAGIEIRGNMVAIPPVSNVSTNVGLIVSGTGTWGGTGNLDFIKATNTSSSITNPTKTFRLNSTGDLEIVNSAYTTVIFSLTNAGVLSTPGGGTSDQRVKQNINYIQDNGVDFVKQLKPVSFEFKNNPNTTRHGFIAQDVLPIKPQLVLGDGEQADGTYGLDYDGILALSIKTIQHLLEKVEYLEKEIQSLKQ